MQKRINAYSVRMVRTELGKMLRKDYESHKIHHGFNEHRVMEVGGILCNSITTVQKDYLICEELRLT
jgi:hypothetical protein